MVNLDGVEKTSSFAGVKCAGMAVAITIEELSESIFNNLKTTYDKTLFNIAKDDLAINKEFYSDLANLSGCAYKTNADEEINGYKQLKKYAKSNPDNGFKANVYQKDNKIIIAYSGSHDIKDHENNYDLKRDCIPDQYHDAMKMYLEVLNDPANKGKEIYVTGHSLGGSLAQLVASTTKYDGKDIPTPKQGISFNAIGTKRIIDDEDDDKNVIEEKNNTNNFFVVGDKTTVWSIDEATAVHPGQTFMFPSQYGNEQDQVQELLAKHKALYNFHAGEKPNIDEENQEWLGVNNHRLVNFTAKTPEEFGKAIPLVEHNSGSVPIGKWLLNATYPLVKGCFLGVKAWNSATDFTKKAWNATGEFCKEAWDTTTDFAEKAYDVTVECLDATWEGIKILGGKGWLWGDDKSEAKNN